MKTKHAYIFVDDGYPEASDYDNNFVSYDPSINGSCERALVEAGRYRPKLHQPGADSTVMAIPQTVF